MWARQSEKPSSGRPEIADVTTRSSISPDVIASVSSSRTKRSGTVNASVVSTKQHNGTPTNARSVRTTARRLERGACVAR